MGQVRGVGAQTWQPEGSRRAGRLLYKHYDVIDNFTHVITTRELM